MADFSDLPPGVSAPTTEPPKFVPQPAKRGPGRPAGSGNKPQSKTIAATSETVTRAIATMNAVYGAAAIGLIMLQLPVTAEALADKKEELAAANKEAFTASPKLAEMIAGAAGIASVSTFFIAHITTTIGLVAIAREEIQRKQQSVEDERENDGGTPPTFLV